jgi:integrase
MYRSVGYSFKREPLTQTEATDLANACLPGEERLVVWTLLDTGLRVEELAELTKDNLDWQMHRLIFKGKGKKRRTVDLPPRIRDLIEAHISVHDCFHMGRPENSAHSQPGGEPGQDPEEGFASCSPSHLRSHGPAKGASASPRFRS